MNYCLKWDRKDVDLFYRSFCFSVLRSPEVTNVGIDAGAVCLWWDIFELILKLSFLYTLQNTSKMMPTQNLLRLLLLLMLIVGIMLATVCYRFGSWRLVLKLNFFQTLSTRVGQDFEVEVQQDFETGACSAFCRWCFVEVMKLNLGRYSEARLGQDFEF